MNVYLVRHGIALDLGEQGIVRDADRPLSDEGKALTCEVARGLRAVVGDEAMRIISSPLLRARETAEIFAKALGVATPVETLAELTSEGDVEAVAEWIERQPPKSLMMVGHMPDMSDLASCLACPQGVLQVVFKKAAVMRISFEARAGKGRGCIEWLLPPGILRRIA